MPAEKQIEAVSSKLVELNPGFDGKLFRFVDGGASRGEPTIENGVVTEMQFCTDKVTDISPVRAFSGLKVLICSGEMFEGILEDLSPLRGMQLTELSLDRNSKLSDLSPLAGMKVGRLACPNTVVSDLSPLRGIPLANLFCNDTQVSDRFPTSPFDTTSAASEIFADEERKLTPLRSRRFKRPCPTAGSSRMIESG